LSYKLKSLKKVENNKVKLDIEITNSHLKKSINRAYREISKKAKIPGFRKGKVPFNIIDINFGKEYVLNEAASISISELYPKIIEESGLKPIDYPKVKIIKVEEDLPLGFEVVLEVEPEIVLPKYRGINAVGISEEITDDEIDKQIDNIRNNYATLEPVEDDKQLAQGWN
jgi:trigger factor